MITDENATILKDWAENVKESLDQRNKAIVHALKLGATVAEIVKLTGLTRARIYQIKKPFAPSQPD
jgi:DNA-directed RNA polymerase specialized sigma subunit